MRFCFALYSLSALLKYANYYNYVINTDGISGYKGSLTKIKMLDFSIVYPFAMELFEALDNNLISEKHLDEIFLYIESYMARRIICGIDSGSLNKMFAFMGKNIKDMMSKEKVSYLVAFKYILLNKVGHYRFPRDNEFEEKFLSKDVYNTKSNYKKYFLAELENYDNKEKIDVYGQLDSGELTIEHIMPQTLNEPWKNELGENYSKIHEEYLHTFSFVISTPHRSQKYLIIVIPSFRHFYKITQFHLSRHLIIPVIHRTAISFGCSGFLWPRWHYLLVTYRSVTSQDALGIL